MVTMMSTLAVNVAPIELIVEAHADAAPRSADCRSQQSDPVPDHAGLPEGERDEDADDVQLDERR